MVEFVKKEKQVKGKDKKITYIPIPDWDIFKKDLQEIREKFSDIKFFVDTNLLTDVDRESAVTDICHKQNLFEEKIQPVIYLSELDTFNKKLLQLLKEKGFCLRIYGDEIEMLRSKIPQISEKQNIHLVIDFGITDEERIRSSVDILISEGMYDDWKSITIASGAFPKDLSNFTVDKTGKEKRSDWLIWSEIKKQFDTLSYAINYGDYTIRYPIFENIHNPNTSFSFRYTGDNQWFIFRGLSRKAKNTTGYIQYRAHAVTLVDDAQYQYAGEDFSSGDKYIKDKAKLVDEKGNKLDKECGSSTTWLQAGVNHHIAKVVKQLKDLDSIN